MFEHVSKTCLLALLLVVGAWSLPAHAQTEAQRLAEAALRIDFERDGVSATDDEIELLFQRACERGYNPACRRSTWLSDGRADLELAHEVFRPACEAGDAVACLVVGWALDARALDRKIDDERDRIWRIAARFLKQHCDKGYAAACADYAGYLLLNKGLDLNNPRPANDAWNKACDLGEDAACTRLAQLHYEGAPGFRKNRSWAIKYASLACSRGYPAGCYLEGKLQDARWTQSEFDQHYSAQCAEGHRDSCWYLARAYYDGRFTEPAPGRTQGLFERACEIKHPRACYEAGRWELDIDGDDQKAATLFHQGCTLGDAAGCSSLVDMILSGKYAGDVQTFFSAFETACDELQSIDACLPFAQHLLDDESTARDPGRAREILSRVCTSPQSDATACLIRGQLYEQGIGGDQDRTDAANFYRYACVGGQTDACMRRGLLLVPDVGIRADHREALGMFSKVCDAGEASGCFEAGTLLASSPTIKDMSEAVAWFERGCSANHGGACAGLGRALEDTGGDMMAARDAYERALQLGDHAGRVDLVRMLWSGDGGKKERSRAKMLCRAACQEDDQCCRGPKYLR